MQQQKEQDGGNERRKAERLTLSPLRSKGALIYPIHGGIPQRRDERQNHPPTKTWKTECAKLTSERSGLNQRYVVLKDEVKEVEQIRKNVYSILRQEHGEQQPRRAQDMEL